MRESLVRESQSNLAHKIVNFSTASNLFEKYFCIRYIQVFIYELRENWMQEEG